MARVLLVVDSRERRMTPEVHKYGQFVLPNLVQLLLEDIIEQCIVDSRLLIIPRTFGWSLILWKWFIVSLTLACSLFFKLLVSGYIYFVTLIKVKTEFLLCWNLLFSAPLGLLRVFCWSPSSDWQWSHCIRGCFMGPHPVGHDCLGPSDFPPSSWILVCSILESQETCDVSPYL